MRRCLCLVAFLLLAGSFVDSNAVAQSVSEPLRQLVFGTFEDDYGIEYDISEKTWVQKPSGRYTIVEWHLEDEYALLNTVSDEGTTLWHRFDWMELRDMAPWEWAFCITTWDAATKEEARSRAEADRANPRTGCGGFPFSRMKRDTGWTEERVTIESDGWELIGDRVTPNSEGPWPLTIMFNQAAGTREPYRAMAYALAERGVASIRIDLPGHGESTNLGVFEPGAQRRDPMIWDAEQNVADIVSQVRSDTAYRAERIALVGASYSGEEVAEAGRLDGYEAAYVVLSPGSFEQASIDGIDASSVPWLFVASREERFLIEITADVQARSKTIDMMLLPGTAHATNLLDAFPDLAERIAVWLEAHLKD